MAASMDEDKKLIEHVVETINVTFGDETKSLMKAKELHDEYEQIKMSVESQLSFATTKAPGKIDSAVTEAEEVKDKMKKFSTEKDLLCGEIDNFVADVNPMVKKLSTLTGQVKELERYSVYLQMIGKIEDYSSDIQSALIISSADRAVTSFSMLADLTKTIQGSNCRHIVRFANETVIFWYKILKEKFTTEFEEVLAAYRWPFIVSTTKTQTIQNATEVRAKLDPLFINLLHLQLPQGLSSEGQPANPFLADLPGWRPLPLPLQLMVKPLRKRFRYHFYGKKQTNSIDKPEWYLTQVLTWIRDHQEFLSTRVQPLLEKAGLQSVDAVTEFSRGLVVMAIEKVLCDVPEMLYDEHIFSHLVDEALAFDRELRTGYSYPASQPGVLSVLTQAEPFAKWIHVEKKFAQERMDAMLSSDTAWRSQYKDLSDVDDTKVPECGESFMTLMLTITDRYKPLPAVSCKLRFLELQLEMLDDYRVRLLQVKAEENNNPLGQVFTAIINTVAYIVSVLREWSELVFFLQLQYYKVQEQQAQLQAATTMSSPIVPVHQTEATEDRRSLSCSAVRHGSIDSQVSFTTVDEASLSALEGCVFDEIIQLLDHMRNDMLNNIVRYVTDDVKARSRPYRKDKWMSLPSQKEFVTLTLSPSACDLLLVLKDRLQLLQQVLAKQLLTSAWQMVASNLDTFIYEELILANHFNEGGASQLNFDMTRNLFPIFGQYTQRPETYFKRTREACTLLTLNVGSGLLLKDVLYRALHDPNSDPRDPPQDPIAALRDLNVHNLSPDDAELVLSLRTDFTT